MYEEERDTYRDRYAPQQTGACENCMQEGCAVCMRRRGTHIGIGMHHSRQGV